MEIDKAVAGILSVRERIEKNFHSPDALSDLATKLAAYNSYIGDEISRQDIAIAQETTRRHLQYTTEGDLSDSAAKTKIKAELAEETAVKNQLKRIHRDANTQISTIQSRLKVLADERRNG